MNAKIDELEKLIEDEMERNANKADTNDGGQRKSNKDKKTSGKFCGEYKKEGMISIMYKYKYNNNQVNQVDQIFKMLPLVLQWQHLIKICRRVCCSL